LKITLLGIKEYKIGIKQLGAVPCSLICGETPILVTYWTTPSSNCCNTFALKINFQIMNTAHLELQIHTM